MPDIGALKFKLGGDLAFVSKKEFDGKLVVNEGVRTATGTLATLTASSGKDFYLAGAQLSWVKTSATGAFLLKVELQVNGVVKETFVSQGDTTEHYYPPYHFMQKGIKVIATQVIKLEVVTIGTTTTVEGSLSCFEEDTGGDPTA